MQPPLFIDRLPTARSAWTLADRAHAGERRKVDGAPFIRHPLDVARLLHEQDAPDYLLAAALLHDVVERGHATSAELEEGFGPAVARLVDAVTEDAAIGSYAERKAALRARAVSAGPDAAILFAADKVAKVGEYRMQLVRAAGGGRPPRRRRLDHYEACLRELEGAIPGHPLVERLRGELAEVRPLAEALGPGGGQRLPA